MAGSFQTACPALSIMAASQVLPLLPVPKIQTMFSGLRPPASVLLLISRARNSLSS
jgi:hypothetical protein